MRCSRIENHLAVPFLEKGQSLIIMIPHRAHSKRQEGKVAISELPDLRAGTTLKSRWVLPWPSSRRAVLISEMRQLRPKEACTEVTAPAMGSGTLPAGLTEQHSHGILVLNGPVERQDGHMPFNSQIFPRVLSSHTRNTPKSDDVTISISYCKFCTHPSTPPHP